MQLKNWIAILVIFCSTIFLAEGQTYLYLEQMSDVKAIKIPEGSRISLKTKEVYEWTTYRIEELLEEENIILHSGGMIALEDITHIRRERTWVKGVAYSLKTFGMVWGVYGLIGIAAGNENIELVPVLTTAASAYGTGYLVKKAWQNKTYKIGSKNRLRIIDLSMPDDPYNTKPQRIRP